MAFPALRRRHLRPEAASSAGQAARPTPSAALYPVGGVVPGLSLATSRALRARP